MKHILSLLFILLVAVSCGPTSTVQQTADAQKSAIVGSWCNTSVSETLTILSDGTFVTDLCKARGTFTITDTSEATMIVTSSDTTRSSCIDAGTYNCSFVLTTTDALTITCGSNFTASYVDNACE